MKKFISFFKKLPQKIQEFILYCEASLTAMAVDFVLFILFAEIILQNTNATLSIYVATIISRMTSSTVNFFLSRKAFKNRNLKSTAIIKFYIVIVIQMFMSSWLVTKFYNMTDMPKVMSKCIADTILYFVFYFVNSKFVFKGKRTLELGDYIENIDETTKGVSQPYKYKS